MKLSIIVPVYNEEKTIFKIIEKVKSVDIGNIQKEIIVIDDGSSDSTEKKLKGIKGIKLHRHEKNQGKGTAVRTGIKQSSGEIIIIQDADMEYNPKQYPELLRPILEKKAKVVYGSRFRESKIKLFGKDKTILISHYIGNMFLSFFTRLLFWQNITDMETCYKVFKREVLKKITLRSKRFDIEPEITAKVAKRYKIYEVPIISNPRTFEEGKKITAIDGIIAMFTLIKYRFFD